jgi:glucokinase
MILAGDIGGTKTTLWLCQQHAEGTWQRIHQQTLASQQYASFDAVLSAFLPPNCSLKAVCLGIAGPVVEQRCQTTNLPWLLDARVLQQQLNTPTVILLNDLQAMALGMLQLPSDALVELNPKAQAQQGHKVVLAAGTGLGEALLYWNGASYQPIATEGGHCDVAAQTAQQDRLLVYLRGLYPAHVSYERLLSGDGLGHLYDFLVADDFAAPCAEVTAAQQQQHDRNAVISRLGVDDADPLCAEAVRLFAEIYGAEAGNLALKMLAIGGVFIGGGIAPKMLPVLQNGRFMQAFAAKGRFTDLLNTVSVQVALDPETPLLGAMYHAIEQSL